MRKDSFERFYMEKVALGEGCGCAEMAINMRDVEARTERPASDATQKPNRAGLLRRLIARVRRTRRR